MQSRCSHLFLLSLVLVVQLSRTGLVLSLSYGGCFCAEKEVLPLRIVAVAATLAFMFMVVTMEDSSGRFS